MEPESPEVINAQTRKLGRIVNTGVWLMIPLAILVDRSQRSTANVWVPAAAGVYVFAWAVLASVWLYKLLAPWVRFSLKSLCLALFSLNICLALIFASEVMWLRIAGYLGLGCWMVVVSVYLIHHGIVTRFKVAEKRHFTLPPEARRDPP